MVAMRGRPPAVAIEGEEFETAGVNSRAELAHLELDWQRRRSEQALDEGATLIAPESVVVSADTKAWPRLHDRAHVVFGPPGVNIANGAVITSLLPYRGRDHRKRLLLGRALRAGCRPRAILARDSRVGNFVELKQATLGEGAKRQSLSYVGDAQRRREGEHRRGHDHLQL